MSDKKLEYLDEIQKNLEYHFGTKVHEGVKVTRDLIETSEQQVLIYHSKFRSDTITETKATLVIAHSSFNHSQRYNSFAHALAISGFEVHTVDFRGYGRSDGPLFGIKDPNLWVEDFGLVLKEAGKTEGQDGSVSDNKNVFAYGSELGAAVILEYMQKNPDHKLKGIVLENLLTDSNIASNGLSFGRRFKYGIYNAIGFADLLTEDYPVDSSKLFKREKNQNQWENDKFYRKACTYGNVLANYQIAGMMNTWTQKGKINFGKTSQLMLSGQKDGISLYKNQVEFFNKVLSKKDIRAYADGRHELCSDYEIIYVIKDVIEFINDTLSSS